MMPYSDSITFQYFLDYFKIRLSNTYCIMFLDNAGWHKSKKLDWGNIIPIYLHPYSPNLNAIEPLWKILKDRLPVLRAIKNEGELQDILCEHIGCLIDHPEEVKSICTISDKVN